MSRLNWIIAVVLLLLPGVSALGWGRLRQRAVDAEIAQASEVIAEAPSAEEYLSLYDEWSQLSPIEKVENPWGQGRYGGMEIQKRLRENQYERLMADLADLNAGIKSYPPQLAEVLYGADWSERLAQFQRQKDILNLVTIAAIVCLSAAGFLSSVGLLKAAVSATWRRYKAHREDAARKNLSIVSVMDNPVSLPEGADPKVLTDAEKIDSSQDDKQPPQPDLVFNGGYFGSFSGKQNAVKPAGFPRKAAVPVGAAHPKDTAVLGEAYFGWAMETQPEEEPVTLMTTEPVSRGLSELTEEVSAIRQYAAAQQDQMRKLQDGYDWMIIRRFCMRIIRCIDNIDDRMAKLSNQQQEVCACLEDIRDELIIALESSGIEQYRPDRNVPFKGLEKYAEAVRQRVPAPEAAMVGAIAEIIRPGYQYLISDDDVKIVRCAQVKLYDTADAES